MRKKLCVVTTAEIIVHFFLRELLRAMAVRYEVTLVVNTDDPSLLEKYAIPATLRHIRIERKIAPLSDLRALIDLYALLRKGNFGGIVSIAPKAGLLAAIAGKRARIPFRCHVFQGEVWATATGLKRWLLKRLDRLVAASSTHLLVVSRSERDFLARHDITRQTPADLINEGSLTGVDVTRFRSDAAWHAQVRRQLDLPQNAKVILFLGRLTRDKGVLDLAAAFSRVAARWSEAHLLFVGPDEERLQEIIRGTARPHHDRLRFAPFTSEPERYLASADIVALPSYREGFGNVLIEAGAAGLPTLGSAIYGISDAIVDGETGILHPPGDVAAIAAGLESLLGNPGESRRMGENGRARALRDFSSEKVIAFWMEYLEAIATAAGGG